MKELLIVRSYIVITVGVLCTIACSGLGKTKPVIEAPKFEISTGGKNSTVTAEVIANGAKYDINAGTAFRREADTRILQNRTDNFTVTVLDNYRNPIQDADVQIKMTRHEFQFGASVHGQRFMTDELRKQQFLDFFNTGVFENYMKWRWDEDNLNLSEPMLEWLSDNNIPVRGHALIWGAWRNMPNGYQQQYENNPDALRKLTFDRIDKWTAYWGNRVTEWDVVNEAYTANDIQKILGDDMLDDSVLKRRNIIDEWFEEAKKINDQKELGLKLYYNDFALLSGKGPTNSGHREWFYKFMDGLIERGVPIDGIGLQQYYANPANPNEPADAEFLYQ